MKGMINMRWSGARIQILVQGIAFCVDRVCTQSMHEDASEY